MIDYWQMAEDTGVSSHDGDMRVHRIGAVGIRSDGAVVSSKNASVFDSDAGSDGKWSFAPAHAENRLCKKLDTNAIVYVVRMKRDGTRGMARPCSMCERVLRSRGVKKVFYSVDSQTYGVWDLFTNEDRTVTKE